MSKTISVEAVVRYPEDANVNGVEDSESSPKMPFIEQCPDEYHEWIWRISIDVEKGRIVGWPNGTTASVYYKVCDCCKVIVDGKTVYDDYVPKFLEITARGFGDYIYIDIAEDGAIKDWNSAKCISFLKENGVDLNVD